MIVGLSLILKGQTTVGDVVEILQPLKVGDGHTTGVDVHVGDDENVLGLENLVSGGGDGTVGGLGDDLGLDLIGVSTVDNLLHGGGDEDVALLEQQALTSVGLGPGEPNNGSVLDHVLLQLLGVDTFRVVDGSVPLSDSNALGSGTGKVPAGMETDISESLDNKGFTAPSRGLSDHGHVGGLLDEVFKAVKDSSSGGGGSAVDAALINRFPCNTGGSVEVCVSNSVGVSISDPGHFSLSSSHVRGRHVNAGPKESLLGELDGEPPGDPLQLVVAVQLRVDLDTGLTATEGDIDTGALVGHQS